MSYDKEKKRKKKNNQSIIEAEIMAFMHKMVSECVKKAVDDTLKKLKL